MCIDLLGVQLLMDWEIARVKGIKINIIKKENY